MLATYLTALFFSILVIGKAFSAQPDAIIIEAPALSLTGAGFTTKSGEEVGIGGGFGIGGLVGLKFESIVVSTNYIFESQNYEFRDTENDLSISEFALNVDYEFLRTFWRIGVFVGGLTGKMNFKGSSTIQQTVGYRGYRIGLVARSKLFDIAGFQEFITLNEFNDGTSVSDQKVSALSCMISIPLHEYLLKQSE